MVAVVVVVVVVAGGDVGAAVFVDGGLVSGPFRRLPVRSGWVAENDCRC